MSDDDWDDYGGAKPPSPLALVLFVISGLLFVAWALAPIVAEFVGAYW